MADATPDPAAVVVRPDVVHRLLLPLLAVLLAFVTTVLCRAAAGVSLGLFFGGFAFAALLVPPLTAAEDSVRRRAAIPCAVTFGVAVVWLVAIGDQLTLAQWLPCSVALLAYAFALCGLCSALVSLRFNEAIAAACVAVLALLWLTWPVWLSHALLRPGGDAVVGWLVPAHPLFAVNSVLIHFDTWDRHPLAYSRLTVLNQDVFYALPRGVAWATLVHGMIGAAGLVAAHVLGRRMRVRAAGQRVPSVPPAGEP